MLDVVVRLIHALELECCFDSKEVFAIPILPCDFFAALESVFRLQ